MARPYTPPLLISTPAVLVTETLKTSQLNQPNMLTLSCKMDEFEPLTNALRSKRQRWEEKVGTDILPIAIARHVTGCTLTTKTGVHIRWMTRRAIFFGLMVLHIARHVTGCNLTHKRGLTCIGGRGGESVPGCTRRRRGSGRGRRWTMPRRRTVTRVGRGPPHATRSFH